MGQHTKWCRISSIRTAFLLAQVVNKAVGGTLACGWAKDPDAIVSAARDAFPDAADGPDFVWYTAGANDLAQDKQYIMRVWTMPKCTTMSRRALSP